MKCFRGYDEKIEKEVGYNMALRHLL